MNAVFISYLPVVLTVQEIWISTSTTLVQQLRIVRRFPYDAHDDVHDDAHDDVGIPIESLSY